MKTPTSIPSIRPAARLLGLLLTSLLAGLPGLPVAQAEDAPYCGKEGVWLQILGAGGPELDDGQAGASYILWIDQHARLLVDPAPGSAAAFDRAGARFEDLDAIVFTHLHADHAADFPAFIKGSYFSERERPLAVLGPTGDGPYPDTATFVERMIGPEGAFAYLSDFLKPRKGGYPLRIRNVPAKGSRRWAEFRNEELQLSAIPVHHGPVPALAWRVDVLRQNQSIVFTGDFNNSKDAVADFAKDVDALVIHHAIPEGTRGAALELHVTPTQIGRIAARADARMLVLGHRMNRTRGRESLSRQALEAHYKGPLIFANDMECWGL
jgi:ribonuclease BN (tRNA processing enzyme)